MKIFIDIDGVLWNTEKTMVELYNKRYDHDGDWRNVKEWNFSPAIPKGTSNDIINSLFASDDIYSGNNTFNGALEYIKKLNDEHKNVYFCTVGKNINNSKKLEMLKRLIPEVKVITISFPGEVKADKSMINMEGAVFIDDHSKNLKGANAKYKILFEPHTERNWNKGWDGLKLRSWRDVYMFINAIHQIEEIVDNKFLELVNGSKNKDDIAKTIEQIKENVVSEIKKFHGN
jgi:5'(3')-deoxyribonucleotidase